MAEVRIDLIANVEQAISAVEGAANSIKGSFNSLQSAANGMSGIMGGVVDGIGGFAGSIGSFFSNVASGFGDLIRNSQMASAEVVGALTLIGKYAIDTGASFERAGIMIDFLTKSKDESNKLKEGLVNLALGSQFTTKEILQQGAALQGQTANVDMTLKGMIALTNAESALGGGTAELKRSVIAMSEIFDKTVPSARQWTQLIADRIPALRVVAEHLVDGTVKMKGYNAETATGTEVNAKLVKQYQTAAEAIDTANGTLAQHQQRLKELEATHAKTITHTQTYTTGVKDLQSKIINLNHTVAENNQWLTDAASKTNVSTTSVMNHKNAISEAEAQIAKLNSTLVTHTTHTKEVIQVNNTAKSSIMGVNNAIENTQDKLSKNQAIVDKYNKALADSSGAAGFETAGQRVEKVMSDLWEPSKLGIAGPELARVVFESLTLEYMGANEKILKTLSGSLANIPDQIQYILARIEGFDKDFNVKEGSIFYKIRQAVLDFSFTLTQHRDDIVNFVTGFVASKDTLIGIASVLTALVIPAFLWLLRPWISMGLLLPLLVPLFFALGEAGKYIFEHWGKIAPIFEPVKKAFDDFALKVGEEIKKLPGQLEAIKGQIATKVQELKNLFVFGKIDPPDIATWKDVWDKAKTDFELFKTDLETDIDKLRKSFEDFANITKPIWEPIWKNFQDSWEKAKPGFQEIKDNLGGLKILIASIAILIGITFLPAILILATTLIYVSSVVAGFAKSFGSIVDWAGAAMKALDGLWKMIDGFTKHNKSEMDEGWKKYQEGAISAFALQKTAIGEFFSGFTGNIANIYNTIRQALTFPVNGTNPTTDQIKSIYDSLGYGVLNQNSQSSFGDLLKKQHGGIIPGPIGAPVPIMAHGGELVTPTTGVVGGGNQGGGGITINITGSISMDSEERVRQLAYQIVRILGRQNELSRYGVGYATGF